MTPRRLAVLALLTLAGCTTPTPGRCICDTGHLPPPSTIPTTTTTTTGA